MEALNLANNSTTNKRRELDYYPTPPDVTHALMRFLLLEQCKIWEPACGDGAMANVLAEYVHDVFATDIRETGYGQGGVDPLRVKPRRSGRGRIARTLQALVEQ